MDCIDLFKRAAMALQTDSRYLALDQARKMNDSDEELQNMIGEFNLARMDLNNEIGKSERNDARIAELNEKVNTLYGQIMNDEGRRHHQRRDERRRPDGGAGALRFLHRQLLDLRRLRLRLRDWNAAGGTCTAAFPCLCPVTIHKPQKEGECYGGSVAHDETIPGDQTTA